MVLMTAGEAALILLVFALAWWLRGVYDRKQEFKAAKKKEWQEWLKQKDKSADNLPN
jgi:hypothetical protein